MMKPPAAGQRIKEHRYREAAVQLEKAVGAKNHRALALLYMKTGELEKAAGHWRHVQGEEEVRRLFDEEYALFVKAAEDYERARNLIRDKEYKQARVLLIDAVEQGGEWIHPEIYRALLLVCLKQKRIREAAKWAAQIPEHYMAHMPLNRAAGLVREALQTKRYTAYAAIAVVAVFSAGFAMNPAPSPPEVESTAAVEIVSSNESSLQQKAAALEAEVAELEGAIAEAEAAEKTLKTEKQDQEDLLTDAGYNIEDIAADAAWNTYEEGRSAFKSEAYVEAGERFTESLRYGSEYYFSDDAAFFLMEAHRRNRAFPEALDTAAAFLDEETKVYTASPYVDDVYLLEAEVFEEMGGMELAAARYEEVADRFPEEWTGKRAAAILQERGQGG
ncbi:tetratricopeptide repeat protein [Alkalicoccus urumqiensis]|uniref:Tetratricopeptide repeat protein n=1 Tax=Alkalicoccus urumqiensis TaxID=1548213 RepID=A0A2P6MHV2_ALKUR|nr:hypothetical protein [Alkalicoccus urumqiensis]PRO65874.1 hypothetical protein C6I21_08235 [Alkalicoccus urumqiensis]